MDIFPIIDNDYVIFDHDTTLSQMIGKLKTAKRRGGLVFRGGKYLGVIDKKGLLKSKVDASNTKISKFVQRTPLLDEHADVVEAAYLMFQSNLDLVPVVRNKQIIGVVSGLKLARLAAALPELNGLKVNDVRLIKAVKTTKNAPLAKAMELMYQQKVDHVPVFDAGEIYGILSYRDILKKYLSVSPKRETSARLGNETKSRAAQVDLDNIASLPVSSFSTNDNLVSVQKDESVKNAVRLMALRNVTDLIVKESADYLGLLTVKNLLRLVGSLKIQQNFNIKFVGLKKLGWHKYEIEALKKIAANEAFKLQREVKNEFGLNIHVKEYSKTGKKHKYSVAVRMEFPGKIVDVSQEDWDWRIAVRKTFNNAKNVVIKMFKKKHF